MHTFVVSGGDRRSLTRLEDVTAIALHPDEFDRVVFNRLNRHHEPALRLARPVLRNLTLLYSHGETGALSFLVDMNDLFQRFVTERLRRAARGKLMVIDEPVRYLGRGGQVSMQPDLDFHDPQLDRTIYVGDVKYKVTNDGRARASAYYQMLACCTALDLPEGVLIYCLDEGAPSDRLVDVVHTDTRLYTVPIDLTGNAESGDTVINELADWLVEHSIVGAAA